MTRLLIPLVVTGLCLGGAVPATAWAGGPPSAIDQYIEQVPTATGGHETGVPGRIVAPLSKSVQTRLRASAGRAATSLERIGTSSAYGAPQRSLPERPAPSRLDTRTSAASVGGPGFGGLLAKLLGLTAAIGVAWLVRRHGPGRLSE